VVNALYPVLTGLDADPAAVAAGAGVTLGDGEAAALAAAAEFRARRQELQQEQVARLAAALPLAQIRLPTLFGVDLGPSDIDHLAAALADGIERLPATRGHRTGVSR
jgi:hypothetical protein